MSTADSRKPGERARWLREFRKIARGDFAKRIGMPYSTLADWEAGRITNTAKVPVHVIAETLGTSSDWILTGGGEWDAPATIAPAPRIEDRGTLWGFDLSREAAMVGADWMKLDDDQRAAVAELVRVLAKRRIDEARKPKTRRAPAERRTQA